MANSFLVGASDSTGATQYDPGTGTPVTTMPLSAREREAMVDMIMANMGLTRNQAQRFLDGVKPEQARTFFTLMDGTNSITRDEAINMWGLSSADADILFPQGKALSTFTNPFSHAFIMFLMLTYSLELDLKQILSEVLQVQKEETIAKAEEIFKGAIIQFATAMTAAIVTGVFAGISMKRAFDSKNAAQKAGAEKKEAEKKEADPKAADKPEDAGKDKDVAGTENAASSTGSGSGQADDKVKAASDGMWFGPIGANLINQPITASGEFGNAWYQREGMYHEANIEEARGIFQQLMSIVDSTGQLGRTASQGL